MDKKEELKAEINFLEYLSNDTKQRLEKLKNSKEVFENDGMVNTIAEIEANVDALDYTIERLRRLMQSL